jgi:DNA polymerase III subunit alpha
MHLHNHSVYSVIDGKAPIEHYVEAAVKDEQKSFALTDHGTLAGTINAYKQFKDVGINFIPGMEMYVDVAELRETTFPGHITVLAKNEDGYRALIAANNIAHSQFFHRPRLTLQQIIEGGFAKDWILLSGCMSSPIFDRPFNEALEIIKQLNSHSAGFFLEFMHHESDKDSFNIKQNEYIEKVVAFRDATDFPVVITNDCHYAHKHQEEIHRQLMSVSQDPESIEFDGEGFYLKTTKEMEAIASKFNAPYAVDNAVSLSAMCNVHISEADNPVWYVPDITGGNPKAKMTQICEAALNDKNLSEEYWERYRYELDVLSTSPAILNSYLVTYDVVGFCTNNGIPVAARGSMAGSLISWLMDITLEDPIKWKLSFNRAVNPARPSIPDFDLDVSSARRPEIIAYLKERFSENIPISSYSHYGPRGALRKILRMEGIREFKDIDILSKSLPNAWPIRYKLIFNEETGNYEYPPTVEEDLAKQETTVEVGGANGQDHESEHIRPDWLYEIPKNYWNYIAIFEGLYSSLSAHPSGILVSGEDRELEHEIPMQWIASSKQLTSAYDMYTLKKLGLYKLDVLGLKTLDQLAYMENVTGEKVPDDNYDDPRVLAGFGVGLLAEIFQMDGNACRSVIKQIHGIETFEDMIAANTLARPGSAVFTKYYRSGFESLLREYPDLQGILGPTNGLILYQEQVMDIARVLADFNDQEQDDIKEAIKYFRHEVWTRTIEPRFRKGAQAKGVDPEHILQAISRMASYTYNRAHAMTYAAIAYKMMWYKIYYPAIYYAAVYDGTEDKSKLLLESHHFKVKWHPADVNTSEANTIIREGEIYLGLSSIKGVGPAACEALAKARPFTDIDDLKARVEKKRCNSSVITKLQESFACASLGVQGRYNTFQDNFGFNYRFMDHKLVEGIYGWNSSNQIAGFVTSYRSLTIKEGKRNAGQEMCMLEVINSFGKTKCVMFPEVWKRAKGNIYNGIAIMFQGNYQVDGSFIVAHGAEIE